MLRRSLASGAIDIAGLASAIAQPLTNHQELALDIYKEINTVVGDTARAAEAMAARLRPAGFPASDVQVLVPVPRKGNLQSAVSV
jgi:hypothetical protein